MIPWENRPREERSLLNPSFCAIILWYAAQAYGSSCDRALSFEESFLVLPLVLHRKTRERLPRSVRTSLAVWLDENPLVQRGVASRARVLVPFTKGALTFGGVHGLIRIAEGKVFANSHFKKAISEALKGTSDEVRACAKRAEFLGRWFAQTGAGITVFALMGVRP